MTPPFAEIRRVLDAVEKGLNWNRVGDTMDLFFAIERLRHWLAEAEPDTWQQLGDVAAHVIDKLKGGGGKRD